MAFKAFSTLDTVKSILATKNISNTLTNVVLSRDEVQAELIAEPLRTINRRFSFASKHRTLELYGNKKVILLSNKETLQLPQTLPAWTAADNVRGYVTYVNFTPFMPNNLDSTDITRKLYAMLQFGTVMNESVKYYDKLAYSNNILKLGAKLYSGLMVKVFDKIAGVGIDPLHKNQLTFFFAKYFMINLLGRKPSESIDAIAHNLTIDSGRLAKESFETAVGEEMNVTTQTDLYGKGILETIKAVTESKDWLNKVNNRNFVQNYLGLYGAAALIGMERIDYFLAIVASYTIDAGIVNDYSLATVFGRDANDLYSEFVRLTR